MAEIVFLLTGAHCISNKSEISLRERYLEYIISLHKVFLYNKPVYGVLSEYDPSIPHCPPFEKFPMKKLLKFPTSFLQNIPTKSQKEFLSIKALINDMELNENSFVIKLSGRYVIMKDTLYQMVEKHVNDENVNAIVCFTNDNILQQYTFFFAMKWKFFKEFYSLPVEKLGTKNIERFIVEFFESKNIFNTVLNIKKLDILANINNENHFQIF